MNAYISIEINGEIADIDTQTAVGLNFQSFNPATPENLFMSYSNTFTIPLTAKNRRLINYADHNGYNSTEIYEKFSASVYLCGMQLFHGFVFVDSVADGRISVSVVDTLDFVESLKALKFAQPSKEIWSIQNALVEKVNTDNTFADFSSLVAYLATGANDLWLPYSLGTLAETFLTGAGANARSTTHTRSVGLVLDTDGQTRTTYLSGKKNAYGEQTYTYDRQGEETTIDAFDDYKNVCLGQFFDIRNALNIPSLRTDPNASVDDAVGRAYKTGHICGKLTTILDLIFTQIGVESNLSTLLNSEGLYVRVPDIAPFTMPSGYPSKTWFLYTPYGGYSLDTYNQDVNMGEPTAWDLIKVLMQEFCLVVDRSFNINTGKQVYTFSKFNDIKNATKNKYKLIGINSKSFVIDGVKQKQIIGYDGTGGENDTDTSGGLLIECANENIEEGSTDDFLFKINRYLPSYYAVTREDNVQLNYFCIDLSDTEAMQKIVLLTPDTTQQANCDVWLLGEDVGTFNTLYYNVLNVPLIVAKQPAVVTGGTYTAYQNMVKYPIVYNVDVLADIPNAIQHKAFEICEVEGLSGEYYIANINNYNPATDKQFTMTIYRLERTIVDGEETDYLLATETQGGAFVITESTDKFITKE